MQVLHGLRKVWRKSARDAFRPWTGWRKSARDTFRRWTGWRKAARDTFRPWTGWRRSARDTFGPWTGWRRSARDTFGPSTGWRKSARDTFGPWTGWRKSARDTFRPPTGWRESKRDAFGAAIAREQKGLRMFWTLDEGKTLAHVFSREAAFGRPVWPEEARDTARVPACLPSRLRNAEPPLLNLAARMRLEQRLSPARHPTLASGLSPARTRRRGLRSDGRRHATRGCVRRADRRIFH